MRNADAWIKRLEKQAKDRGGADAFCRVHPPPPVICFEVNREPPPPPDVCERCGKPFPPGTVRPVICFIDTAPPPETGRT